MIRQEFHVEEYWKVVVYWNIDHSLFSFITQEMVREGFSFEVLEEVEENLRGKNAKAATISNVGKHVSYVLFNRHKEKIDYINSVVHECVHVKQAMLEAYDVEDKGEAPAYTMGYLVGKMYGVLKQLL